MSFAAENAKTLRQSPDVLSIVIKDIGTNTEILNFTRDDIIECLVALRGVDTKFNNPELQASTIEFKAYYTGDESAFVSLRGRDTRIEYKCAYSDAPTETFAREFYTTFDEDGLQLDNHILSIKGTDWVGRAEDKDLNLLYTSAATALIDDMNVYITKFLERYKPTGNIYPFVPPSADGPVFNITPGTRDSTTDKDWNSHYVINNQSNRKVIAQWMNIFRGVDDAEDTRKFRRFVFRDAGVPCVGWGDYRNANLYSPKTGTTTWGRQFYIDYEDVSDLKVEYGNAIKTVKIDNPRFYFGELVWNSTFQDYVYQYDGQDVEIVAGETQFINFDEPVLLWLISASVDLMAADATQITPTTIKVTSSIAQTVTLSYGKIQKNYNSADKETVINTGMTNGDEITLDPLLGFAQYTGTDAGGTSYSHYQYIKEAITRVLTDDNLIQPKWITFTWRGHPNMQPRDMICFTEADGETENWYEVDNLTLEHRDGGLISKVKAIFKRSSI